METLLPPTGYYTPKFPSHHNLFWTLLLTLVTWKCRVILKTTWLPKFCLLKNKFILLLFFFKNELFLILKKWISIVDSDSWKRENGSIHHDPTGSTRYKANFVSVQTLDNRKQTVFNSILIRLMNGNKKQLYWKKREAGKTKRFLADRYVLLQSSSLPENLNSWSLEKIQTNPN